MFAGSRFLAALLAMVLVSLLSSCAGYVDAEKEPDTNKQKITYVGAVGGKGSLIKERHYPSGVLDRTIFTWDNEDSFRRAASLPVYQAGWNGVSSLGNAATKAIKNQ